MSWGYADMYGMDADASAPQDLLDVNGSDWRNILVVGRATATGVFLETLALVGRARYLADELGCRVEVLLMGEELDAATEALKKYHIDNVYKVRAPDYAPIDHTARIIEQVVRKRRPELVMVFQSRTGDAITAYAANRLGVGHVIGAVDIRMDTMDRKAIVTARASNDKFETTSRFLNYPQFVSVQRGLFRAPMEDPYSSVNVYDLDVEVDQLAKIEVVKRNPAPAATLQTAERLVVVGSRVVTAKEVDLARELAASLDALFAVAPSIVERGLSNGDPVVKPEIHMQPRLLVAVGVRGSLDFLRAIDEDTILCAVGCDKDDAIAHRASYMVCGAVGEAVASVIAGL